MPQFGLALSGGGLRATLFHLGVVRFLRDAGLLSKVTHIVSVSGGSILGAHLALNWARYNGTEADFDEAASKIISFASSDVRNQIARRIPFLVPLSLLRRLTLRGLEPGRHADWPAREAVCKATLWRCSCASAPGSSRVAPPYHEHERGGALLVHEGRPDHAAPDERGNQDRDPAGSVDAGRARGDGLLGLSRVLPARADHGRRSRPLRGRVPAQTFTDGGVYDNLGVRVFDLLEKLDPSLDQILVSDVGKPFSIVRAHSLGMVGRSMRATDILWDRVGQLEKQKFQDDPRFLFVAASDQVDLRADPTALHPAVQSEVAKIRTDLDRFSPVDITALCSTAIASPASSAGPALTFMERTCQPNRRGTR